MRVLARKSKPAIKGRYISPGSCGREKFGDHINPAIK
jgi:hypothetical protein